MPSLTDEDKVIRNDVGKRIAAAIESLSAPEAEKVSYDNTESGMTADNIQDAVDELKSDIDSVELADLDDVNLTSPQDEDELHYDSTTSKWKNIAKKIYEKSASGSLVSFNDGGDNIPLKSLIANITAVQSGSGTPSPSNVRAISGWSGINVLRSSKNLWVKGNQSGTTLIEDYLYPNISSGQYTLSLTITSNDTVASQCLIYGIYNDGTDAFSELIDRNTRQSKTFTLAKPLARIRFYASTNYNNSNGKTLSVSNVQLESGSSATTYEEPLIITLPFGQTFYGGTLDILSGLLTITYGSQNLGDLSWTYQSTTNQFRASFAQCKSPVSGAYTTGLLCSIYKEVPHFDLANENYAISRFFASVDGINVKDSRYTDANDYKTAMNGIYLYYPLKTPITMQLTPAQVSTLLGQNNIFADTGDISLSYFTQNANAINNIAESNMRTALNTDVSKTDLTDIFVTGAKNNTGSTITAGTYFYANGQLALCKQAISANADLTLNTNYELVTAGALNKLMSNVNTSLASKLDSANPTGTGSLSLNRKSGTTTGNYSATLGRNCTASGVQALAEGGATTASGISSHSEGNNTIASGNFSHTEGEASEASGNSAHAENYQTTASGLASHTDGYGTIANHKSQHVFGEFNTADASTAAATSRGNYVEIVGNGASTSNRSNARTLDWSGNETLAGDLTYKGNVSLASMLSSYSLSSTASITLSSFRFSSAIILGYAQGIGDVAILVTAGSNVITSTIDLKTGTAFSSSHLTFSISNNTLTIASDNASVSTLTIIRGN